MEMREDFLLDEVRCGFLVPAAIKQAWAAELEVLAEIDRVCKKHNIQYFADWGTLLGAVRHGGFVPWDDDLDIVMKREDYMKFLSVAQYDMGEGFHVQTYQSRDDLWSFMAKVVGRNQFCFEKEHLRKFHNFFYIASVDVFVLDYVYAEPEKEEKRRNLCKNILGVADAIVEGKILPGECENHLRLLENMYGKQLQRMNDSMEMGRYLYGEVEKIFASVPKQEAKLLTQMFPAGLKGKYFQFPKEYYEKVLYLPFEYMTIPVPAEYEKMLQKRYGNYLKVVKNSGAHDYPFFESQKENLLKVLDFPFPQFQFCAEKLFRGEEEKRCKEYSYKVLVKESLQELKRIEDNLFLQIEDKTEQVFELLETSQQLAIDLGGLLEQVLGEDLAIIPMLEKYCEILYLLYQKLELWGGACAKEKEQGVREVQEAFGILQMQRESIREELEKNILIPQTVLFLPVLAKDWSGLQSRWEALKEDNNCRVMVMPLPYFYKDYDGTPKELRCDAMLFPEEVQIIDYQNMNSEYLELLHPEQIIIQNPYDEWHPNLSVGEMYYAERLRKYTDELIYIPPFQVEEFTRENERAYGNQKYYVNMPGVVYADKVLVQSSNMKSQYVDMLTSFAGEKTRSIWEHKVRWVEEEVSRKRSQEQKTGRKECSEKKKILYGIDLGLYTKELERIRKKICGNLQIFTGYRDKIEVSILLFSEDEEKAEHNDLIEDGLSEKCGIRMLKNIPVNCAEYDAYYGDAIPVIREFREAKKPVMLQNIFL